MKRLLAALILAAACSKTPPRIDSFVATPAAVTQGDPVVLTWSVHGATSLNIDPAPGAVSGTSVTVTPNATTTFTLTAKSPDGTATATAQVTVGARAAVISSFSSSAAVVETGKPVTLSWSVQGATKIEVLSGSTSICADCTSVDHVTDAPQQTTTYSLRVTGAPGTAVPPLAKTLVRVGTKPNITSFTINGVSPGPVQANQGDSIKLAWAGDAVSWSVSDGTKTTPAGTATSLTLRPPVGNVTYTLTGLSVAGIPATATATVNVAASLGTMLVYTAPTSMTESLKLVADPCGSPCTSMIFHLQRNSAVSTRGAALNLPLDSSKVTVAAGSFGTALTNAVGGVVLGTGPLTDVLVLGVSRKGAGGTFASDETAELASFTLNLNAAGGKGTVFDGATLGKQYMADVRGGSAGPGGVAIGKLIVQ